MLVLTRSVNEEIIIQDNVFIRILNVQGKQVRLGITAPKDIPVHREEVFWRLKGKEDHLTDKQKLQRLKPEKKVIQATVEQLEAVK